MAIELCEHYMRPNRCAACLRARVATLEAERDRLLRAGCLVCRCDCTATQKGARDGD